MKRTHWYLSFTTCTLGLCLAAVASSPASAATLTVTGATQDGNIEGAREVDLPGPTTPTLNLNGSFNAVGEAGGSGNRFVRNVTYSYTLPNLPAGQQIVSAEMDIDVAGTRQGSEENPGLLVASLLGAPVVAEDYLASGFDAGSGNALIGTFDGYDGTTFPTTVTFDFSGDAVALLNGLYAGGVPSLSEVFVRLSTENEIVPGGQLARYDLVTNNGLVTELRITTVPEPATLGLVALMGFAAAARVRR